MVLIFVIKKLCFEDGYRSGEGLKKQLMNYFNNDSITNNQLPNYDSIEKGTPSGNTNKDKGKNKEAKDAEQKQLIPNDSINYDTTCNNFQLLKS